MTDGAMLSVAWSADLQGAAATCPTPRDKFGVTKQTMSNPPSFARARKIIDSEVLLLSCWLLKAYDLPSLSSLHMHLHNNILHHHSKQYQCCSYLHLTSCLCWVPSLNAQVQ